VKDAPIDPGDFGFTCGPELDRSDRGEGVLGSEVDAGLFGVQAAHDPKGVIGVKDSTYTKTLRIAGDTLVQSAQSGSEFLDDHQAFLAALDDLAGR